MDINIFKQHLAVLFLILISVISVNSSTISDKRLCYDDKCSEPISFAKALLSYSPNVPDLLGFKANDEVVVFSKAAGNRKDLWGVEINGKRGYVPLTMIREYKVIHKILNHIVSTEVSEKENNLIRNSTTGENVPSNISNSNYTETSTEKVVVDSEKVTPTYEIVEGTTIHLTPHDEPPSENLEKQPENVPKKELEKQPILTVHPNIVSSTINFVTSMFDSGSKSTENLDDNESDEDEDDEEEYVEEPNLIEKEPNLKENINEDNFNFKSNDTVHSKDDVPEKNSDVTKPSKTVDILKKESDNPQMININEDKKELTSSIDKDKSNTNLHPDNIKVDHILELKEDKVKGKIQIIDNAQNDTINNIENIKIDDTKEEKNIEKPKEVVNIDVNMKEEKKEEKIIENVKTTIDIQNEKIDNIDTNKAEHTMPNINTKPNTLSEDENKNIDNKEMQYVQATEQENKILDINPISNNLSENVMDISQNKNEDIHDKTDISEELKKTESLAQNNEIPVTNSQVEQKSHEEIAVSKDFSLDNTKVEDKILKEDSDVQNSTIKNNNEELVVPLQIPSDVGTKQIQNDYENNSSQILLHNSLTTESSAVITENSVQETDENSWKKDDYHSTIENLHSTEQTNQPNIATERTWSVGDLLNNRNLLNANNKIYNVDDSSKEVPVVTEIVQNKDEGSLNIENITTDEHSIDVSVKVDELLKKEDIVNSIQQHESLSETDVCEKDSSCPEEEIVENHENHDAVENIQNKEPKNLGEYMELIIYVSITAFTTLVLSLGYYYIENYRRDSKLIAKINELERELMIATNECTILDENLKSTTTKLNCIEDNSFGSNEMVASLKVELENSKKNNLELEDQVATLEKELESASEAGLELERMLREVLSSHNDDNPLAKSIEDLQTRLNAQQTANESLTNALNLKVQENESLSSNLADSTKKCEEFEKEVNRLRNDIQTQSNLKIYMEQNLSDQIQRLEIQFKSALEEKNTLRNELKEYEQRVKELSKVIEQYNVNDLDFEKLFDVAHVKAEVAKLTEERDELKIKLSEVEGAHELLEEHVKIVDEQITTFGEQCKLAEKEKKEAETRLEVLSNFFNEKETQRQKEEALWMQQQGEVASTVERIQTMQNEMQNYRQQVEILKREIIDQEKEYKSKIAALETKCHEQWVHSRQSERKLEESKSEASLLRNRLTVIEKNLNDIDPESKLHRLEVNGETPSLFLGRESSSSPIMFAGTTGIPPPQPKSMFNLPFTPFPPPLPLHHPPPPAPSMPNHMHFYEGGQRLPPVGARLSPPPPVPSIYDRHRSPPPPQHFSSDHPFHPLPPLPLPLDSLHSRGDEPLPHNRYSGYNSGPHHQREQRTRNHKGSLHSSGESLDKSHHSGKV